MYCLLLLIVFALGCGFSVLCFVGDFMIVVLGLFVCLFCYGIWLWFIRIVLRLRFVWVI